jgi:peptidyl-prolyl cis-trans isomerase C
MSCTAHQLLRDSKPVEVSVNGVVIPRDKIAREIQHHPASKPIEAWLSAARALVVRELLLQEARRIGLAAKPLSDEHGRRETEEDALIRGLIEREIVTPEPDEASCRRYYEQRKRLFRSRKAREPDLPFDQVAGRIADYLRESVRRRAVAQYIARLVSQSEITGVALAGAETHRVN